MKPDKTLPKSLNAITKTKNKNKKMKSTTKNYNNK